MSNNSKIKEILKFWFGDDYFNNQNGQNYLDSNEYKHKQQLWFELKYETDLLITEKFGILHKQATDGLLDEEFESNGIRGKLALIIIYSQFSRFIYRGLSDEMFNYDSKAIEISRKLIIDDNDIKNLSCIEKYFVYFPLLHSENLNLSKQALDQIENLPNQAANAQKEHFFKYYKSAQICYDILIRFKGRFPFRNKLLNRPSTKEEIDYLNRTRNWLINSVQVQKKKNVNISLLHKELDKSLGKIPSNLPITNILFLHGFRQNSNKLKKRTKLLINMLKSKCNANITFLNGTHPYKQHLNSNEDLINSIESQRAWYHSNEDATVYEGIEESIEYVTQHAKKNIYDGIIGFSQGGVLASIIIKKNPILFKYFISISSLRPRAIKYNQLYSTNDPFDFPSLHIYGASDLMIDPSKSIEFSKCFKDSQLYEHKHGHFSPLSWPNDMIVNFILSNHKNSRPLEFNENESFESNIARLNEAFIRFKLNDLDTSSLHNIMINEWSKDLIKSKILHTDVNLLQLTLYGFYEKNNDENIDNIYDKLIIIYILIKMNKEYQENIANEEQSNKYLEIAASLFCDLYAKSNNKIFLLNKSINLLFIEPQQWKCLILICDKTYDNALAFNLYKKLINIFAKQLAKDLKAYDRHNKTFKYQELTSISNEANDNKDDSNFLVSELAKVIPRIKSSMDKHSRLARECARVLNPFAENDEKAKIHCYNKYRKILTNLNRFNELKNEKYINVNPRAYLYLARSDKSIMEKLMLAPLSDAIIDPVPEPVDYALREEMKPLHEWLASKSKINFDENDLKFLKGTVTTDGRLDLCKQVIGPSGIEELLDAMQKNQHIDRLLLGNNIIGDEGAKYIADFIKSGKSPLTVWYVAGNNFSESGLKYLVDALINDNQVNALWLKRNPLKSGGMLHIASLIRFNQNIKVLDLINCGLLDEGLKLLSQGLVENNGLRHLYLSANGITPKGLLEMEPYFANGKSKLETLFLGCNRIGDAGAKIIGDLLKNDSCLIRLNIASSRIGSNGMKYLSDNLKNHPNLMVLDLGYMRSTIDLGELGNCIEDDGIPHLIELIKYTKIISLNITHNHITQFGLTQLINALDNFSKYLIYFDYVQFGIHIKDKLINDLKLLLERNKDFVTNEAKIDYESIVIPDHVKKIYSVYRTH